jgi:hypothetical protein
MECFDLKIEYKREEGPIESSSDISLPADNNPDEIDYNG